MIEILRVPAFADNYIWLAAAPGSRAVAIVDPGEAEPLLTTLAERGQAVAAVLVTHHHGDHTGGISAIVERYRCPVYGPAHESVVEVTHPLADGDRVELPEAGLSLSVMETPGHTRGHLCYTGHDLLFCGDTLFTAGCGRLFEGTPTQMYHSLIRLAALPDETRVHCAHEYTLDNLRFALVAEPDNAATRARYEEVRAIRAAGGATVPTSLGLEKRTNPFLRCDDPALKAAAERYVGHPLPDGAEVFAAVRRWKDDLD